jgi:hypothetical protein
VLVAKFNRANSKGNQLLGRVTASQSVLIEFKSHEAEVLAARMCGHNRLDVGHTRGKLWPQRRD